MMRIDKFQKIPFARFSGISLLGMGVFLCLLLGCASNRYMLDEPVNDPIMTFEDQQDADLCKAEEGGSGGAGGECPT